MPLPVVERSLESFGANDTSYTQLLPDWDAPTLGYSSTAPFTPVDIAVGEDGYLFVADSANDRIVTLAKSGHVVTGQRLNTIAPIPHPQVAEERSDDPDPLLSHVSPPNPDLDLQEPSPPASR